VTASSPGASLWLLLGYQGVWLASAFGAAAGSAGPGVAAAALLLGLTLRRAPAPGALLALAGACAALGLLAESALAASGLISYRAAFHASLAPAWIITLWAAFAVTLSPFRHLLGAFALAKAAVIGAVLGPLAYVAGARLGALTLAEPGWRPLAALAVVWAVSLPALMALATRLDHWPQRPAGSAP